jgi:cation:H+ antiporter
VGSNLFNILAVLGITAVVSPSSIPISDGALTVDIPVMIAVAILCLPIFWHGYRLMRWEGYFFLVYYAAYITWLILDSGEHDAREQFAVAMIAFVIPMTLVTFGVIWVRARRERRSAIG